MKIAMQCHPSLYYIMYLGTLSFAVQFIVFIRFSNNPQQKDTIGDIIWRRRKKCATYGLDIFFSITHAVQLMVSKINLLCQRDICRYPQRDIGRKILNFIPCEEVEKWQRLTFSM